jgi:hypothetical protein
MAYFGGCSSPVNQPTAPDFMGSDAMAICSLLDAFPVDAALAFVGCGFAATAGDVGINHLDTPKVGLFPVSVNGPYGLAANSGVSGMTGIRLHRVEPSKSPRLNANPPKTCSHVGVSARLP